jgi:hypothetical protein
MLSAKLAKNQDLFIKLFSHADKANKMTGR